MSLRRVDEERWEEVRPDAQEVLLAIAGRRADGSGKNVCQFNAEPFIEDLHAVLFPNEEDECH